MNNLCIGNDMAVYEYSWHNYYYYLVMCLTSIIYHYGNKGSVHY